jgi:hypothetical protein
LLLSLGSRFRKWSLSKPLTQSIGAGLGVVFAGGLLLALVLSSPQAPEFSEETTDLARAAAGDPVDPPTPELKRAEAARVPAQEAAEPLDASAERRKPLGERRFPEAYRGEKVVYAGQIFQIQEEEGLGFMLLSITDEGYGFWTDNIWVNFTDPIAAAEMRSTSTSSPPCLRGKVGPGIVSHCDAGG